MVLGEWLMAGSELSTKCYCCEWSFVSNLPQCPTCGFPNMNSISWIPEKAKEEFGKSLRPISPEPTEEEIRKFTEQAASECNFTLNGLDVRTNQNITFQVTQSDDDYHKLIIEFNPKKLRIFTHPQILALLRHEIMHSITMKGSFKLLIESLSPDINTIEIGVQTAYDELINYKEYVKINPNDKNLHSAKEKQFGEHTCGFFDTKYKIEQGTLSPVQPYVYALSLYESVSYYFFEQKQKLEEWVKENQCQALFKFLEWIHDDLDLIHEQTQTRDEMQAVILIVAKMILTVSMEEMFLSNKLSFNDNFDSELKQCKTKYTNKLGQDLLERWKNRHK